jgi:AraC-like DNA-binding protein
MLIAPTTFARFCRARERLHDAEDSTSIGGLAHELGMSPFQFIRAFSALFGSTPHQLRIAAKIEHAKQLLASSQRSVTRVCMELGFSSLGSFSSSFARRVGKSPSRYREEPEISATPGCLSLLGQLPEGALRNFEEARGEQNRQTAQP